MGEVITTQAILPFKYEEEKLKPVGGWINPCFFQEQEHAVQNTNRICQQWEQAVKKCKGYTQRQYIFIVR
ncbi:MAG: hypothetical protein RBQ72_03660 [Desulfobacterium sp.]|jgi:hypothetical protein|nr:hypothetical protein [Desulfobacterium sp.]